MFYIARIYYTNFNILLEIITENAVEGTIFNRYSLYIMRKFVADILFYILVYNMFYIRFFLYTLNLYRILLCIFARTYNI